MNHVPGRGDNATQEATQGRAARIDTSVRLGEFEVGLLILADVSDRQSTGDAIFGQHGLGHAGPVEQMLDCATSSLWLGALAPTAAWIRVCLPVCAMCHALSSHCPTTVQSSLGSKINDHSVEFGATLFSRVGVPDGLADIPSPFHRLPIPHPRRPGVAPP